MTYINVCEAINCPFNSSSNGCQIYSSAVACHLRWQEPGVPRPGMAPVMTSEYWLYATEDAGIERLRQLQEEFLQTDRARQALRFQVKTKEQEK